MLHKQKVLSGAVWVVGALLSTTRMRTVWGSDSVETWSGVLECAASPDYSNFDFRSGHVVRVGLEAQVFHMGETSVVTSEAPAWPFEKLAASSQDVEESHVGERTPLVLDLLGLCDFGISLSFNGR